MHKILLVSVFGKINSDSNDRVNSLYDYLSFTIKIVTTDFSHSDKKYRSKNSNRNIDYLHVKSYKKNLSFFRILSHWIFGNKLFFYLLKNGREYDAIYCITPTPSSAFFCAVYKSISKHKFLIIDVIDIWPESLIPLLRSHKWVYSLLLPWKWLSIYAYKKADAILGATKEYQYHAAKYNHRAFSSFYPLGIDFEKAYLLRTKSKLTINKPPDEIWITYAGNLGAAYDFDSMIAALLFSKNNALKLKLRFVIIGGGDRKQELEAKLIASNMEYIITGNLEYTDFLNYLFKCDIGFNIYLENSKVIQSYKFYDYIVSGLFLINNLHGETSELIENYNVGVNVFGNNNQLGNYTLDILNKWEIIRIGLAERCLRLMNEKLSKKSIYDRLNSDLTKLIDR